MKAENRKFGLRKILFLFYFFKRFMLCWNYSTIITHNVRWCYGLYIVSQGHSLWASLEVRPLTNTERKLLGERFGTCCCIMCCHVIVDDLAIFFNAIWAMQIPRGIIKGLFIHYSVLHFRKATIICMIALWLFILHSTESHIEREMCCFQVI